MKYNDEIIDAHMHLWDLTNDYQWLKTENPNLEDLIGNYDKIKKNFLAEDYLGLAHKFNITKSVHVQAIGFLDSPVLETSWLQYQFENYGVPNAIVAYADLTLPNIESLLVSHCKYANMRGIRMILNYHDVEYLKLANRGDYMQDIAWRYGFSLLEKYNLLFEAQVFPHQIADLKNLAQDYPNILIVLEHFAWPLDCSDTGFIAWKSAIQSIAACNNVVLKLSNLLNSAFSDIATIYKYINAAIEVFGAGRCMFGSNCPPDMVRYDMGTIIDIYKSACSIYSIEWQRQIFYDNAARVYRI